MALGLLRLALGSKNEQIVSFRLVHRNKIVAVIQNIAMYVYMSEE